MIDLSRRNFVGGLLALPFAVRPAKVLWDTVVKGLGAPREKVIVDRYEGLNVQNPKPGYRYYWVRSDKVERAVATGWERVPLSFGREHYNGNDLELLRVDEETHARYRGYQQ